jgi:6-phosphogluconolactonase (cycloisomerase 2 family)/uncharacterized protein YjdB
MAACNDTPRLQFVTVAPISGEIYVSAQPVGGVKGAIRHAHPALQNRGTSGRHAAATLQPVTASCGSLQYAATALFSDGSTQDATSSATWTSSNSSVASIDSSGLATGLGLGTTNIGASFQGVSATSEPLAVDQLNSITLSPPNPTIALGLSQSFVAIGNFTFAAGGSGDLDVSGQVTWNSSNTNVATIDSSGNATSVGPGSTNITATSCDGIMVGKTTLIVGAAAPQTLQISPAAPTINTGTTTLFTALELLSDGTTQPLTGAVTWTSGTTTAATIDANTGVALGLAVGTSTITATEAGTGFSGTTTLTVQAATARFAYVADAQGGTSFNGTISGYSVDVTAAAPLTPLPGSPVAASSPQQVLLHPSGDLMYYIDSGGFLHIDDVKSADGSFSESGQTPIPASTSINSANVGVIDPTGRFIYVISGVDNTIYGFSIAQTADKAPATNGVLTPIPSFNPYTDANLNNPSWIMTDRSGKYVYVVNGGTTTTPGNTISEYSIGSSGALTPLPTPTIATGTLPLFGTTDVNGHLYVANQGPPQSVSGYSINSSTGQLTSVGADTVITGATFTINVITDPTGKYLYVLDSTTGPPPGAPLSHVFAFNLNSSSGVIGAQIGTPQLTGNSPFGMAIDPTGVLMAIDNNFDNTISLFTLSTSTGAVTPATPPTVATDTQPLFVVFYTAASGQ